MKKIIIVLCVALAVFGIAACTKDADMDRGDGSDDLDTAMDTVTFAGTIIELNDDSAIVEPFEGEAIRGSADKISIDLGSSDETFAVGDTIEVEYDGAVMESYPAQVNVLGIEKID